MSVSAVIFDIDGTLVDSVDLHARAWHEALQHFGYGPAYEKVRHEIGKGSDKLIPDLIGPENAKKVFEPLDKFRSELWHSKYFSQVKPFPSVRELFERVRKDGIKIALASSAKANDLKRYKQIANIDDLVHEATSSDDIDKSKPSPDAIEAALATLGHPDPATVIMIGDTPWDIMAAATAGVASIGVLSGGFAEEELRGAGALAVYRDPADLLVRYATSPLGEKEERAA